MTGALCILGSVNGQRTGFDGVAREPHSKIIAAEALDFASQERWTENRKSISAWSELRSPAAAGSKKNFHSTYKPENFLVSGKGRQ
jgi:hypothetical protein